MTESKFYGEKRVFAREGFYFVVPSILFNIFLILWLNWIWQLVFPLYGFIYFAPLFSFTGFLVFFFRDPGRKPEGTGILAPSDGKIRLIKEEPQKVTFFIELKASNVHTQKSPVDGNIVKVEKIKGKHYPIFLIHDKARDTEYEIPKKKNARNTIDLVDEGGTEMNITQISGVFARRCVTRVKQGDTVKRGKSIGIILFGSLVKFEVKGNFEILVKEGDRIKGGKHLLLRKVA